MSIHHDDGDPLGAMSMIVITLLLMVMFVVGGFLIMLFR
jgi:hypothetical protein